MNNITWDLMRMVQSSNVSTEDLQKVGTGIGFTALAYIANKMLRKPSDAKTLEETFVDPVEALNRNQIICNAFEKLQNFRPINPHAFHFMITRVDHIMFIEKQMSRKAIIGTLDDVDDMMSTIHLIRESMNRFLYSARFVTKLNMKSLRLVRQTLKDIMQQLPIFSLSIETMCFRYNEQDILLSAKRDVQHAINRAKKLHPL